MRRVRGLTLVELLVAVAVFALVMTGIFAAFRSGMFGYRSLEDRMQSVSSAALILSQLERDLHNAFAYDESDSGFSGTADTLEFFSRQKRPSGETLSLDLARVTYRYADERLLRTCRLNADALIDGAGEEEEFPSPVAELNFAYLYFDSKEKTIKEKSSWAGAEEQGDGGLPAGVRVTLLIQGRGRYPFSRSLYLAVLDTQ